MSRIRIDVLASDLTRASWQSLRIAETSLKVSRSEDLVLSAQLVFTRTRIATLFESRNFVNGKNVLDDCEAISQDLHREGPSGGRRA